MNVKIRTVERLADGIGGVTPGQLLDGSFD
jgi:hypothetical protein